MPGCTNPAVPFWSRADSWFRISHILRMLTDSILEKSELSVNGDVTAQQVPGFCEIALVFRWGEAGDRPELIHEV
jgi:hypothetical protein